MVEQEAFEILGKEEYERSIGDILIEKEPTMASPTVAYKN